MAIRYRTNRKKPYLVYWRNPDTKKIEGESFLTEQEALRHDALVRHALKHERAEFPDKRRPAVSPGTLTIEGMLALYLRKNPPAKSNLQPTTSALWIIADTLGHIAAHAITRAEILAEMQRQTASGISKNTVKNRFALLKAAGAWAQKTGLIRDFPVFTLPRAPYVKLVPPSPEESDVIRAAAAPHVQRAVIIGSCLGVRVGQAELFSITWADVFLDAAFIRVRNAAGNPRTPWRDIPIRADLMPLIRAWHDEDAGIGATHLIHYKGKPVGSIKTAWKGALKRAGITRRIRPYDLRRAFAAEETLPPPFSMTKLYDQKK